MLFVRIWHESRGNNSDREGNDRGLKFWQFIRSYIFCRRNSEELDTAEEADVV